MNSGLGRGGGGGETNKTHPHPDLTSRSLAQPGEPLPLSIGQGYPEWEGDQQAEVTQWGDKPEQWQGQKTAKNHSVWRLILKLIRQTQSTAHGVPYCNRNIPRKTPSFWWAQAGLNRITMPLVPWIVDPEHSYYKGGRWNSRIWRRLSWEVIFKLEKTAMPVGSNMARLRGLGFYAVNDSFPIRKSGRGVWVWTPNTMLALRGWGNSFFKGHSHFRQAARSRHQQLLFG